LLYGATPLHYAAAKPLIENLEILFKFGANLSAKDNGVCFVIMEFFFLIHLQPYHWAGTMNRRDIQVWLVDHGAQVRDY